MIAALSYVVSLGLQRYLRAPRVIPGFVAKPIAKLAMALGVGLAAWAMALFRRQHTTVIPSGEPSSLVTGGPYRLTRNPMYVGTVLVLTGMALRNGSLPALAAPVLYIMSMESGQIRSEEDRLNRLFPDSYQDYRRRVSRWV